MCKIEQNIRSGDSLSIHGRVSEFLTFGRIEGVRWIEEPSDRCLFAGELSQVDQVFPSQVHHGKRYANVGTCGANAAGASLVLF